MPAQGGIKRRCCLTSGVCLSRTSGLSREQRDLGITKRIRYKLLRTMSTLTFKTVMKHRVDNQCQTGKPKFALPNDF